MSEAPRQFVPRIEDTEYLQQLFEHLGVAVIATDRELNIRTWNSAAARMFGAGFERMAGVPVGSVLPQERRQAADRMLRRAIRNRTTIEFEFQDRDAQGDRRELVGTIAPVLSESGECLGTSLCIRDITRRIVLQNELNETRKMASLGELSGAIAHHFNNILGGVITSIDFAVETGSPAVQSRVLSQASRALQRATTLVNGLLAFSQGDRRADDLSDFTEVLNNVADETEASIEGRGIDLTLNMDKLPVLPVARVQMSTVFHNILQNAVEAMPGGGTLRIDVSLEPDAVVTRISDTGCGLDEEAMSRIFEPFWGTKGKLSSTTGEGTGLGLAIARGLVQVIGGTIAVESKPDEGSCFTVTLPRPTPA